MSENTLTTEAVRAKYARGRRSDGTHAQFVKWQKEFDRWLAAHDAEVLAAAGVKNREELIEELHRLCDETDVETSEATQGWLVGNIRAALARFEKAQAPTDDEREDMIAWLMRDQGDDLSPLGRDYTDAEIADMLRRTEQTEPTEAQVLAAMTDPNRITDEQADAAQLAHYRFVFGEEGLPNRRELGIYRQAMKVAISEAVRAAQGEPSDTTPEGAEVTFFTQLDSDYAEESATLAQAEHVRREASGLIPPAGRKITKRVTYWVDMPAAFATGQEEQS